MTSAIRLPASPLPPIHVVALPGVAELLDPRRYLGRHSRSFGFASMFMRGEARDRVARVYAWCRFTDDLVDRSADDPFTIGARLDSWVSASREAYLGRPSGVKLLDTTMREMVERGIPFRYAEELARGVRTDLHFTPVHDLDDLRIYTYRVAGVVGRWLTELHGVYDSWMLDRATALGHAMQLTNILRDVGEDSWGCRLYLPTTVLARHGLRGSDVESIRRGEREIDDSWRNMVEDLASIAEQDYRFAREAIPELPAPFRYSVAVAAGLYEQIIEAIRRNDYDNVNRRAFTSGGRKIAVAAASLWRRPAPAAVLRPA
jgi:15-cis-phytoene synthase